MSEQDLREGYQLQTRNTVILFLHSKLEVSVNDLAVIFKLNKATVSRIVKNTSAVNKDLLIRLARAFKV